MRPLDGFIKEKMGLPQPLLGRLPGGSNESVGSPAWRNICKALGKLKPLLCPSEPRNWEEWCTLPLWRPHLHYIGTVGVKCSTLAQHCLCAGGLSTLGDIFTRDGRVREWEELNLNINDAAGRRAYQALTENIQRDPQFETLPGPHQVFFGEDASGSHGQIWQFDVHQHNISSNWPPIRDFNVLVCTLLTVAGSIQDSLRCDLPALTTLYRVILRIPVGKADKRCHYGAWSPDRNYLLQYQWSDTTPLLATSTSQLRPFKPDNDSNQIWL